MNWRTCRSVAGSAALVIAGFTFALAGCTTPSAAPANNSATAPTKASAVTGFNGATLWAQNCGHCHNMRSPDSYSDAQWEVAMLHMRVRANLTAEEHRQILAFLKSAH